MRKAIRKTYSVLTGYYIFNQEVIGGLALDNQNPSNLISISPEKSYLSDSSYIISGQLARKPVPTC